MLNRKFARSRSLSTVIIPLKGIMFVLLTLTASTGDHAKAGVDWEAGSETIFDNYLFRDFLRLNEAPRLLTVNGQTRAIALEASTLRLEPFPLDSIINFGSDKRTRLILFGTDFNVSPTASDFTLTAEAEDGQGHFFPLQVEHVDNLAIDKSIYAIHLKLNDEMADVGDVLIRIIVNGIPSNGVRVGIGRIGGGPPDDYSAPMPSVITEVPRVEALSPASVETGSDALMLSVGGANFTADSTVFFNGQARQTAYINDRVLIANLLKEDLMNVGDFPVLVSSMRGISGKTDFSVVNSPSASAFGRSASAGASAGLLSGSRGVPPSNINLTNEGSSDWVHWGLTSNASVNRKTLATPQIGNFTRIGTSLALRYNDNPIGHTWTDGAPIDSVTRTKTGVYTIGAGNGFQITAPADTTLRTLRLYVGVWAARGKLSVNLSDNSAPTYVDVTSMNNSTGTTVGVYTLNYRAAANNQQLVVRYMVETPYNSRYGNVTLQAATLSAGGGTTSLSPTPTLTPTPAATSTPRPTTAPTPVTTPTPRPTATALPPLIPIPTPTRTATSTPQPTQTPNANSGAVPYSTSLQSISGLWGHWKFDETSGSSAADSSGNAHHLSYVSSLALGVSPLRKDGVGRALQTSGASTQYATVSSGLTTASGLTVALTLKPSVLVAGSQGVFSAGVLGGRGYHSMTIADFGASIDWRWFDGSQTRKVTFSGGALRVGRISHLVISHAYGSTPVCVLDGKVLPAAGDTNVTQVMRLNNGAVNVGGRSDFATFLPAVYDETAVYTIPLSVAQARMLFRSFRDIPESANSFVVSPSGSYFGRGTVADPLDLPTATAWGLATSDTQFQLRGGTYSDIRYSMELSGTSGHPIIYRPYAHENPILDLRDPACNAPAGGCSNNGINIRGSYLRLQELEITNSNTSMRGGRTSRTSSNNSTDPGDTERGDEIAINIQPDAIGAEVINCRIHDVGTGIFTSDGAQGTIIYGNILSNVGWLGPNTAHGPSLYLHNRNYPLLIKHNIFANGLKTIATQIRATQSETVIDNVTAQENISYGMEISVLNSTPNQITFSGNQIFNHTSKFGENDQVRKGTGVFTDNYIYSGANHGVPAEWNYWNRLTVTGNTLIGGPNSSWVGSVLRLLRSAPTQTATMNNNTYYAGRSYPTPFIRYLDTTATEYTFSNWKALGYDAGSSYFSTGAPSTPTINVTRIYPNTFAPGRGNIVIWNWQRLTGNYSLTVDLAALGLTNNQRFEIRNAFNWDAGPVTFRYQGAAVTTASYRSGATTAELTPVATSDRALWIGQGAGTPMLDNRFQVFVVNPL